MQCFPPPLHTLQRQSLSTFLILLIFNYKFPNNRFMLLHDISIIDVIYWLPDMQDGDLALYRSHTHIHVVFHLPNIVML